MCQEWGEAIFGRQISAVFPVFLPAFRSKFSCVSIRVDNICSLLWAKMYMVIRHNCYVINHVKMRISFLKGEKEKMQCEIPHSAWLGQVSINHPQDLSHLGAAFEHAVGRKAGLGNVQMWNMSMAKCHLCNRGTSGDGQMELIWALIGQINSCTCCIVFLFSCMATKNVAARNAKRRMVFSV